MVHTKEQGHQSNLEPMRDNCSVIASQIFAVLLLVLAVLGLWPVLTDALSIWFAVVEYLLIGWTLIKRETYACVTSVLASIVLIRLSLFTPF